MLRSQLEKIVRDQDQYLLKDDEYVTRELSSKIRTDVPKAMIISGVRRAGKSTMMRQMYRDKAHTVGYLHFDDPRLHQFEVEDFYVLEDLFAGMDVFQFDEIHKVDRWEEYVRHAVERGRKIGITGSNAYLLSKELGTLLTGRHITSELFPFNFREFLNFKDLEPNREGFDAYFKQGGFPEAVTYDLPQYHSQLLQDIIQRDIAVRNKIRNLHDLTNVALHLVNNLGRPYSYSSLARAHQIRSTKSVIEFVQMLADSYLIFQISAFSYSFKKQQNNPKKSYIIDHAFARANSTRLHQDEGRYLENMVFIHERANTEEITYFKDNGECDFVINRKGDIKLLQVCWEINNENFDREKGGLENAMKFFGKQEGTIITYDQRDEIRTEIGPIKLIPFFEYYSEVNADRGI